MKNLIITIFLIHINSLTSLKSQVLISDNVNSDLEINVNAILELRSQEKNKGILLPSIMLTSRILPNPFSSHVQGMIVYNTQTSGEGNNRVFPGLYYNDGTNWNRLIAKSPILGDVKFSNGTEDHDGWYFLNGRNLSELPTNPRANATALGFNTTIPDARNKYLKAKSNVDSLGEIGGNNSIVLSQSNLPNFEFSGTTPSFGNHSHTYNDRGSTAVGSQEINNVAMADDAAVQKNTSSSGNHNHAFSFSTGGNSSPIDFEPLHMNANIFIYLGK